MNAAVNAAHAGFLGRLVEARVVRDACSRSEVEVKVTLSPKNESSTVEAAGAERAVAGDVFGEVRRRQERRPVADLRHAGVAGRIGGVWMTVIGRQVS